MPIDINTFRTLSAKADGANLLSVEDGNLKSTTAAKSGGSAAFGEFKAATVAFLDSYEKHYGAALGQMARNTLQEFAEMGRPLSVSVVSQLIKVADESKGSRTCVKVGDVVVDLSKLGTDKLLSTGVSKSTQLANAQKGGARAAEKAFLALAPTDAGKVDVPGLLRQLETLHAYTIREMEATGLRGSEKEIETYHKALIKAIDALDNRTLSEVYQGLVSRETVALKKELARIVNHPDANTFALHAAERFFSDISRLESIIVSEVSRRMMVANAPEGEAQNVPSLMNARFDAPDAAANRFGGDKDMTTLNLEIMTRSAAQGTLKSRTADEKTDAMLKAHGMGAVDAKKIGDMIRSQELTINMRFSAFMGKRKDGSMGTPLLQRQNPHVINVFEDLEERNLDTQGDGYLKHRNQVEKCFFPEYSKKPLAGKDRPVYGALNIPKLTSGAADTLAGTYGRVVVVLKPHVKRQCTYALDDTFFAARLAMPESKRAEVEDALVAAFASRLKDPAATLAALRSRGLGADALDVFYTKVTAFADNMGAKNVEALSGKLAEFFKGQIKEGAAEIDSEEIQAHFIEKYALSHKTQSMVADYDHIENLLAQTADFTAVSMGLSTLRQQEDPRRPYAFEGMSYIEAQFHGPVLLNRDVEELRIDTDEMQEYFLHEFDALPQEQQDEILADARLAANPNRRKDAWAAARCEEEKARIKQETDRAPYKVTFYSHYEKVITTEFPLSSREKVALEKETTTVLKDDLVAVGRDYITKRRGELMAKVLKDVAEGPYREVRALYGQNLENLPAWLVDLIDARMRDSLATIGDDGAPIVNEGRVFSRLVDTFKRQLGLIEIAIPELRANNIENQEARDAVIKEMLRLNLPSFDCGSAVVRLNVLAERALADVNAFAREVFERDIEDGPQLMANAFNGFPMLEGVAKDRVMNRIRLEVSLMKTDLSSGKLRPEDATPEKLAARLRQKAVQPFIEPKARIMQSQKFMKFPTEDERRAFLLWAASAGKLRNSVQFEGVYECSGILTDMLEAKITSGEDLGAQDLIVCYKAFCPTCYDYIQEDAKTDAEYGSDDRMCFVSRITSVALSRLRQRVGQEGLAKLANALDTPDARWLYAALERGFNQEIYREGSIESATTFMHILHMNLPNEYGFRLHPGSDTSAVNYRAIPPSIRAYIVQINREEADRLEEKHPYDPGNCGGRRLLSMPAPAIPGGMPQNKAARKEFLLQMLPTYHNHEKTFDRGTNWHGRTHATRSFVFSIAMANILREKGVAVDLNAVALGTAGHDTGREANGGDQKPSETRSANNVNAAVDQLYPGAAGDAWKEQIKANITSKDEEQTTIEGYLLKSADSLDYTRIDEINPQFFPFLKTPVIADDGFIIDADNDLRTKLMREARLLSERTDPGAARLLDMKRALENLIMLDARNASQEEKLAAENVRNQIQADIGRMEIEQTENKTDAQIVEMVENVIRDNPQDFPLLTKYYLNAV